MHKLGRETKPVHTSRTLSATRTDPAPYGFRQQIAKAFSKSGPDHAVAPNLTETSFDTPGSCIVTP